MKIPPDESRLDTDECNRFYGGEGLQHVDVIHR